MTRKRKLAVSADPHDNATWDTGTLECRHAEPKAAGWWQTDGGLNLRRHQVAPTRPLERPGRKAAERGQRESQLRHIVAISLPHSVKPPI
jgi:hypothetical protein